MATISEREAARIALRALRANRLRSTLTTLGIVIGIAAVIIGVALGNGVQAFFDEVVGPLSTQVTIRPLTTMAEARTPRELTDGDASALADRTATPHVNRVVPLVLGTAVARAGSGDRQVTVLGTTPDYFMVTDRDMVAGRPLDERDTGARTVVLGSTRRNGCSAATARTRWVRGSASVATPSPSSG